MYPYSTFFHNIDEGFIMCKSLYQAWDTESKTLKDLIDA